MKNLKINLLIIPFLSASAIFVLTMVFLAPRLKEIGILKNKNTEYRKTLNLLTAKATLLEGIDKNELKSRVEKTLIALPAEKDIPHALVVSRTLTKETGVTVKKIAVEANNASTAYLPSFAITITAETEMDKIVPFLERIETAFPLLGLEKLALSSRGQNTFEISFVLSNFYLDYPEKIGTPEAPLPQISSQEENTYQLIIEKFKPLVGLEVIPEGEETGPMGKPNPFIP